MTGLRVAILDDAPYLSWGTRVYAANATFHRFAAALLDVRDTAGEAVVTDLALAVPVRAATTQPDALAVDPRIRIIATEPFDGIAGYIRRAPLLVARNAPHLRRAFAGADVVLLRLPASNGLLGAVAAIARDIPRVAFVVGSVAEVVAGQRRAGPAGVAARIVGAGYDAASRLAGLGAVTVVVGARDGVLSSLVLPEEIHDRTTAPWPTVPSRLRIAYAGRLADGKGLEDLLAAVALLASAGPGNGRSSALLTGVDVRLDLVGDGPAAAALASRAARLGIADRVRFTGYLADRQPYLEALGAADLFVTASPAEGFPKAVLDAMAAGLPVVAVPAGRLADLVDERSTPRGPAVFPVRTGDPAALAAAVRTLVDDPSIACRLREAGTTFVQAHTMPAEAVRLAAALSQAAHRQPPLKRGVRD